jgi:metal-dependent amidase/aminoacylase/carboxypeptidase family protein
MLYSACISNHLATWKDLLQIRSIYGFIRLVHDKVKGKQSHGAEPWKSIDPIIVSSAIIQNLQTIVSRQMDLTQAPVIITVGKINAGVRPNIIPEEADHGRHHPHPRQQNAERSA